MNNQKHDRHLDQHPHNRRQCGARIESEQTDRRRHGELEKIRGTNQGRRTSHIVFLAKRTVEA